MKILSGSGRTIAFAAVSTALLGAAAYSAATVPAAASDPLVKTAKDLFSNQSAERQKAIGTFIDRGNPDAIAALIQLKRFSRGVPRLDEALAKLSGEERPKDWHGWMLWQEAHPEIKPFDGFAEFKADVYRRIDPNFDVFLYPDIKHDIRLEEIAWGGVRKDGIPALTNPRLIAADAASYLRDDELVFGVSINDDVRAYPFRIMDWHEMFNDVIGGVPVSLAYCTLCGSGILFETTVEGRDKPFVFGSSGFLYRSNKLMYDQETHTLWNQFTGRPVVGTLTGSGIELKTRPVTITSWKDWRAANPETKVLSLETGYTRDYRPGAPYARYFNSPDLMFPALVERKELKAKDYVFALRSSGTEKAWPVSAFKNGKVINDTAGVLDLVLIGDAKTRTVRAYRSEGRKFSAADKDLWTLKADDGQWMVTEEALIGPKGETLDRLPGHIAFWFAWSGYMGDAGEYGGDS